MSFEAFLAMVLGINLLCAVVCAFIAGRSGRDPFSWVLAGGMLGPFALVALIAARGGKASRPARRIAARGTGVLVPVDGSAASLAAVEFAIAGGAPVTLLAVLPLEREDGARSPGGSPQRREYDEELASHLTEAKRRFAAAGVGYRIEVRFGDPAAEVLRLAAEGGVDHIIMGRRGRGGVAKLLLGSVSERVVKESPIPVMLAG